MGTQTDLTVEQITQMKKDLEYFRKLLYQGAMEIERLEKELSEIEQEKVKTEQTITKLQAQVKDLTPNEQEKSLLKYCELGK
jgi:septal ring factor EnvC (AmiA/AmiB activator)